MKIHGKNSTDVSVSPGEKNVPITFNLKNHGSSRLYGISSELVLDAPFNDGRPSSTTNDVENNGIEILSPSKTFQIGQLNVDQSREIHFKVDVDQNVDPGFF